MHGTNEQPVDPNLDMITYQKSLRLDIIKYLPNQYDRLNLDMYIPVACETFLRIFRGKKLELRLNYSSKNILFKFS